MYSKTLAGKAPKGSIQTINSNGRLQLRFRHAGKRHHISLGLPDTPKNRKLAEMKANKIDLDIRAENFDQTLARYKPQSSVSVVSPGITPTVTPNLKELWDKFLEYKRPQCSPNMMKYMYNCLHWLRKQITYSRISPCWSYSGLCKHLCRINYTLNQFDLVWNNEGKQPPKTGS